ncbi:Hypothetical predicted protein [Paramuricea clavata]|uniref:Uncharacterized protein n=1 Tax=Paramuricea clavata TaxID=317549 RepID=A0A6S7J7D3_PARCT|nr:Hypothetical predicted protein [Paramuricea clavata]
MAADNDSMVKSGPAERNVGEYAMKMMKQLEAEGRLKTRRRNTWLIRRHMEVVEKFCDTPRQVLGLSLPEFKERVKVLQSLEISLEDALVIALSYPSCLSLNSTAMFSMVSLLKMYRCYLPKHFMKNPYVFSLDSKQCESNLQHLKKIGLSSESIGNLIDANPIVLTVPLSNKAEKFAKQAENYQSSSNILRFALKSSLLKSGEQVSLNEDFNQVVSFLKELKIDISKLMQKCPEFLCTSYASLLETYQFLCGAPLYCEKSHVAKLLMSNPHAFLQMNKSLFQQSIQSLSQIIDSNMKLYWLLQKSPMLFVDSSSIPLERIELLKQYQFSDKEIVGLLEKVAFVFSSKSSCNLEKKLRLLLSTDDITTGQVCKSAFILRAPLDKLQKRLFFIKFKKPDVLKLHSLNDIFFSNNHKFINEICGSTLTEYLGIVDVLDHV